MNKNSTDIINHNPKKHSIINPKFTSNKKDTEVHHNRLVTPPRPYDRDNIIPHNNEESEETAKNHLYLKYNKEKFKPHKNSFYDDLASHFSTTVQNPPVPSTKREQTMF